MEQIVLLIAIRNKIKKMVLKFLLSVEFANIVRIILGVLFTVSAIMKLSNLKGFASIVESYRILPKKMARVSGYIQPFIELIAGGMILTGFKLGFALIVALGILLVATSFVVIAIVKKRKLESCGCLGPNVKIPVSWNKVVENIGWMVLCMYLLGIVVLSSLAR